MIFSFYLSTPLNIQNIGLEKEQGFLNWGQCIEIRGLYNLGRKYYVFEDSLHIISTEYL